MATRYFVGGNGTNVNATSPTNWSDASGGAGNSSIPGLSDDAILDANSGPTVTLNVNLLSKSFNASAFNGTLVHNNGVTLNSAGDVAFSSGMTYSYGVTSAVAFSGLTDTHLTTAGQTMPNVNVQKAAGTATVTLQDDLVVSSTHTLLVNEGVLDASGKNVTAGAVNISGGNSRTLSMGAGLWTLTGNPGPIALWNATTTTNLTFNKGTANIVVSSQSGARIFMGGGLTYNGLTIAAGNGQSMFSFNSNAHFSSLEIDAPMQVLFGSNSTVTVDSAPAFIGTAANPYRFTGSTSGGTPSGMSVPSGDVEFQWAFIDDVQFGGGAVFTATNSLDGRGATGVSISTP